MSGGKKTREDFSKRSREDPMLKMHVDCVEGFAQMTEGTHLALFFPPSAQEVCEFLSPNFTKDA